jgi:hypothetical protein
MDPRYASSLIAFPLFTFKYSKGYILDLRQGVNLALYMVKVIAHYSILSLLGISPIAAHTGDPQL